MAEPEKTESIQKRSLRNSIVEGSAASVMNSFGDAYVSPAAIHLGATNQQIGILGSLPHMLGAIAQMASVKLLDMTRRRKATVLLCSFLQGLMWLPMLAIPLFMPPGAAVWPLIAVFTLYVVASNFLSPAWNSWMGDIVPPEKRGRYFGKRNGTISVVGFTALITAGLILHRMKAIDKVALGFAILFGVAFLARMGSTFMLSRIHDPGYVVQKTDYFSLLDFLKRSPNSNFAHFVFYVSALTFSVQVAAPFFTVYMLRDLKFNYLQFMFCQAAAVITQLFVIRYWGKLGDRFGNKKLLNVTGVMVAAIPMLWAVSGNFYFILMIQGCAAFAWAGFGLAAGNFIYDAVTPAKRARCFAYYSLFNGAAIMLGATVGSILASRMPREWSVFGLHIVLISGLQALFFLSGVLRLLAAVAFKPTFQEVRNVESITSMELFFKATYLRSVTNFVFSPFSGERKQKSE
jgi:MFS family permease